MNFNQTYELYLVFAPNIAESEIATKTEIIVANFEKEVGAMNINIDNQGLRKTSYPIKKHWSGYYVLVTFEVELENLRKINGPTKKLNIESSVIRYIITNQTEFIKQKTKETVSSSEIKNHRELNKTVGKFQKKKCICKHNNLRVVDYKDSAYLNQFTSPYAKLFHRSKTGTSAKFQRKITTAIKRARHIGFMPFTTKHYS